MFRVVDYSTASSAGNEVLLVKDNWNDWFIWITQFFAHVVCSDGTRVELGAVKIARTGMTPEDGRTKLPGQFTHLEPGWFSIGQSENYYETLNGLGPEYRQWFLASLQDCASDLSILDRFAQEEVLRKSLLRDIDSERVRNRFHRLSHGDPVLTPFAFQYTFPPDPLSPDPPSNLTFRVSPDSRPPTNVHVLIGRNGVGKTRCFDLLTRAFLGLPGPKGGEVGTLTSLKRHILTNLYGEHGFAGLVTVSFSPFDKYGPLAEMDPTSPVKYAYVGLIRESAKQAAANAEAALARSARASLTIKSQDDLTEDFVKSVASCRGGARGARWVRALEMLEADPLFEEVNVSSVGNNTDPNWRDTVRETFKRLSSGHSVVLLTITKLVELVEEKTLVLIDEPEGHLHPPLLSAFIRALSDLLTNRNGVALIATHSPVVLQEAPRECVWILNRSGHSSRADRPETETFGENTGVLTREVFGLEVTQTGFHRTIREAIVGRTYEQVLDLFGDRLGGEARGLARALSLITPEENTEDEAES